MTDAAFPGEPRPSEPDATTPTVSAPAATSSLAGKTTIPPRGAPERSYLRWGGWVGAWLNMALIDHGFFRLVYLNFHRVGQQAWRAAQPAPHHFGRFARKGVKTVVNLRGGREFGSYPLELEACERYGLAYEEIKMRSRAAPAEETIEEAIALLDRIEYPVVFHCKSGADRTGLMAAIYLIHKEGLPAREAKLALSAWYGHFRQSKTGVLDAFIEAFEAAQEEAAARGETLDLLEWSRESYDAKALLATFRANSWWVFVTERLLRRE